MSYLLDTDVIIQSLAGRQPAISMIDHLVPHGIAVSLISVGEVFEGVLGSSKPEIHLANFRQFLGPFQTLSLNHSIAVDH